MQLNVLKTGNLNKEFIKSDKVAYYNNYLELRFKWILFNSVFGALQIKCELLFALCINFALIYNGDSIFDVHRVENCIAVQLSLQIVNCRRRYRIVHDRKGDRARSRGHIQRRIHRADKSYPYGEYEDKAAAKTFEASY